MKQSSYNVESVSTDVLLVRFLQEERLERSCRLLHQGIDDFMQVGAGNLEETIKLASHCLTGDPGPLTHLQGFLHR